MEKIRYFLDWLDESIFGRKGYCPDANKVVLRLLEKAEKDPSAVLIEVDTYSDKLFTASICGQKLWITNYPYCFGAVIEKTGNIGLDHVPALRTRIRLHKLLTSTPALAKDPLSGAKNLVLLKRSGEELSF